MKIAVITLFPEMFASLDYGISGRAIKNKLITLDYFNPREYTSDPHRTVDDRPYGGGPGMLMLAEPLIKAITAAKAALGANTPVIYLSPQGQAIQQNMLNIAADSHLILLSGRYEGIDERIIEHYVDYEWSLGDYVLSGGELAAMVVIDALTRLIPGALGDQDSAHQDSFSVDLLDCPHYTRPRQLGEHAVPDILLSGDHQRIKKWRLKQSLGKTYQKRPDIIARLQLSDAEQRLLNEYMTEINGDGSPK